MRLTKVSGDPDVIRSPLFSLGLCTFGILGLELSLIRWMSSQIRIFAYFSNLVLIAAFLGMGLGIGLGRRRPGLVHLFLPALVPFAALLAFAPELGLMRVRFPDPSISLWGGDGRPPLIGFVGATLLVLALFWTVAALFLLAAAPVGWLFDRLGPLRAYSVDLAGSLFGVIALTGLAILGTTPAVWLAVACLPTLLLSRRLSSLLSLLAVVALAGVSVRGALFSPYNRLDLKPDRFPDEPAASARAVDVELSANRDYHQHILDLSDETIRRSPEGSQRRLFKTVYELPFRVRGTSASALVVGAGTGNDVAAALRLGYRNVTSVEIDPVILRLGARLHPERPYADPRVTSVVNDARAYFEQNPDSRFDVVCYGLLDSHAMFSSMSSLRLENYVYTLEGIRAGWRHVADDGLLSISFSVFAGEWITDRMYRTIQAATGLAPVIVPHRMNYGATFLVARHRDLSGAASMLGGIAAFDADPRVRIPTDDWPFLYLRPGSFPYAYVAVLLLILATAVPAIRRAYRPDASSPRTFDLVLFLMGAAFLLLETRMVSELSLLFGSTWVVNACVFTGILLMVLAANAFVQGREISRVEPWFAPLAATLLLTWATGAGRLNQLPLLARGLAGGVVYALPVAFAGVIFSTLLRASPCPSVSLGSNLLGAVVGGLLEYFSMLFGLRSLALMALSLYLGALLLLVRSRPPGARAPG